MVLESTIQTVCQRHGGTDLLVLFGSTARGQALGRSDVDLGIVLQQDVTKNHLSMLQVELERALKATVDIVDLSTAPLLLRFEVARDGRPLIETNPEIWKTFRYCAIRDWWDWVPTARAVQRHMKARLARQVNDGPA